MSSRTRTELIEPLESAETKNLTLKMAVLLAIASLKRVGDLQELSVSPQCLELLLGELRPSGTLVWAMSLRCRLIWQIIRHTSCDGGRWKTSFALPCQSTEYLYSEVLTVEQGRPVAGVFWVPQEGAPRL